MWNRYNDWDNDNEDRLERLGLGNAIRRNEEKIEEIKTLLIVLKNQKNYIDKEYLAALESLIQYYEHEIERLTKENESYKRRLDELEGENC